MQNFQDKISLVLIHGWGCDQSSWQPLVADLEKFSTIISIDLPGFGKAPMISDYSLENILSILIDQIPDNAWVMGWSFGGMLAVQLAHRYPQKISGIITLAANAKFVVDVDYSDAMHLKTNQEFNQSFIDNPAATLKLFSGLLAKGAQDERGLLKQSRKMLRAEFMNSNWHDALVLLSNIDNRNAIVEINQTCLHIFADGDALVPVSAASCIKQLNPQHQVEIVSLSSHALHWCFPELLLDLVRKHIESSSQQKFKLHVAKKFSRAALTYDQAADAQRVSGNRLLNEFVRGPFLSASSVVIDLGCGTGFFSSALQMRFKNSLVVGVDLSFDMLSAAQQKSSVLFVGGDAEKLPFADKSIDLIYSNFALQWCFDLPLLFDELLRVLKPGAELVFTTLGHQSLQELTTAWRQVDEQQHVNSFVDKKLIMSLMESKFSQVTLENKLLTAEFDCVHDVLHSLKSVGATYHAASSKGLMGRKKLLQLTEAYEQFRRQGKLPLTYDVIFARAKKSR